MSKYRKGSHIIYDCKFRLVWITKYRYRILSGKIALRTREIMRIVCQELDVAIVKGHLSQDHVHMLDIYRMVGLWQLHSVIIDTVDGPIKKEWEHRFWPQTSCGQRALVSRFLAPTTKNSECSEFRSIPWKFGTRWKWQKPLLYCVGQGGAIFGGFAPGRDQAWMRAWFL